MVENNTSWLIFGAGLVRYWKAKVLNAMENSISTYE